MKKTIAISFAVLAMAAFPALAPAQGDGGSQTSCELKNSSCKQTAHADHQFCRQSSGKNCQSKLNAALQSCSRARRRCNAAAGGY